jgi:hypothetical protein
MISLIRIAIGLLCLGISDTNGTVAFSEKSYKTDMGIAPLNACAPLP